jgi:DNA-binding transcriptional regulator YiaG
MTGRPAWPMSAEQFKRELRRVGTSKRALARVLHVSRSTVYRWATGEVEIPGPVAVLMRMLPKRWKP